MLKIGNVEIKNKVIIAPMAGVSNSAFRSICYEFGAGLVYSEMISDKALHYKSNKTYEMCHIEETEHPISLQLFGGSVDTMVEAAKYLDDKTDCDVIDINMGCPVNKIIKSQSGSYLLQYPELAVEIVEAVVKAVKKPVTVKMRIGWDSDHINCVELAKEFERVGVKAIAVHGRTRGQMYEGNIRPQYIRQVKEAVSIPVFGNGDIRSVEDAKRMIEETGCDAIMVGRGAVGNPFLIKELVSYFNGEPFEAPSNEERIQMALNHAKRLCDLKGEHIAMKMMRGLASWYIQGMPFSASIKNKTSQLKTYADLENLYMEYLAFLATNPLENQ